MPDAQAPGVDPKKGVWAQATATSSCGPLGAPWVPEGLRVGGWSSSTSAVRTPRRSPCTPSGAPAHRDVLKAAARNRGKNTTLIASMTYEGTGPCLAIVGSTTAEVFESYAGRILAPAFRPGQILAMDNLNAHKTERMRQLIERRGCSMLYLPTCLPDNLIEEAFAKIEAILRKVGTCTRGPLVEAMGLAL